MPVKSDTTKNIYSNLLSPHSSIKCSTHVFYQEKKILNTEKRTLYVCTQSEKKKIKKYIEMSPKYELITRCSITTVTHKHLF